MDKGSSTFRVIEGMDTYIDREYGVEIPSEDLEKIATVNDIIEYLKNKGVEA